jgi:hypothetical protein
VHPFWLSHKEKRPWLELSREWQPWPELELHGRSWESLPERGERGKEWARVCATAGGASGEGRLLGKGEPWGCRRSSVLRSLFCVLCASGRGRKHQGGRRREEREKKRRREGKNEKEKK